MCAALLNHVLAQRQRAGSWWGGGTAHNSEPLLAAQSITEEGEGFETSSSTWSSHVSQEVLVSPALWDTPEGQCGTEGFAELCDFCDPVGSKSNSSGAVNTVGARRAQEA